MNNIKKILTDAEWAEYQRLKAQKPTAPASLVEELKKQIRSRSYADENDECNGQVIPVCDLLKIISRYTQEEKPAVFDWCKLEGNVCQYCKSHTHKCPNRIEVTLHDIAMKIRELQKPPANADMVSEIERAATVQAKVSRETLFEIIAKYRPVKAPADSKETAGWKECAAQMSRNAEYYRGLVVKIGAMLGSKAYIADDGSKSQDVLCAKVPELVAEVLKAPADEGGLVVDLENWIADGAPMNREIGDYSKAINEISKILSRHNASDKGVK